MKYTTTAKEDDENMEKYNGKQRMIKEYIYRDIYI